MFPQNAKSPANAAQQNTSPVSFLVSFAFLSQRASRPSDDRIQEVRHVQAQSWAAAHREGSPACQGSLAEERRPHQEEGTEGHREAGMGDRQEAWGEARWLREEGTASKDRLGQEELGRQTVSWGDRGLRRMELTREASWEAAGRGTGHARERRRSAWLC